MGGGGGGGGDMRATNKRSAAVLYLFSVLDVKVSTVFFCVVASSLFS